MTARGTLPYSLITEFVRYGLSALASILSLQLLFLHGNGSLEAPDSLEIIVVQRQKTLEAESPF